MTESEPGRFKAERVTCGVPNTTYAVALLYRRRSDGTAGLLSRMVTVSGLDPLTREEAVARVRKLAEREWDSLSGGPLADWDFELSSLAYQTVS